jgi:hypothetical protein
VKELFDDSELHDALWMNCVMTVSWMMQFGRGGNCGTGGGGGESDWTRWMGRSRELWAFKQQRWQKK